MLRIQTTTSFAVKQDQDIRTTILEGVYSSGSKDIMFKHRSRYLKVFIFLATFFAVSFISNPAQAEIDLPQDASWGVSDFSYSNSVARFSALAWDVEETNNKMFVGGQFINVTNGNQTISQPNFARFNLDGTWDSSFTPTVARPVLSMQKTPDGGLMLGGEIRQYNGRNVGSLVKIDPTTGNIWPGWNTRFSGGTNVVREVTLEEDGWLYAVGTFTNVQKNGVNTPVTNVVRMNPNTGAIDTSWTPFFDGGSVWDVSVSKTNNTVYFAGWFDNAAGSLVSAVGIDTNNDSLVTWNGYISNQGRRTDAMYAIEATEFGTVWVGGTQHGLYIYDENQNMDLVVNHITSYDSRYQPPTPSRRGGEFQEIVRIGDRIYATCHCWGSQSTGFGTSPIPYRSDLATTSGTHSGRVSTIIAYDPETGLRIQSFNVQMSGDIGGFGATQASDGCLWVAGGIDSVGDPGNRKAGRDLVRLCDGPAPIPVITPPASCVAIDNGNTIEVSWPEVANMDSYVIRRSVNGSTEYWRGVTTETTFTDSTNNGNLVYYVTSKLGNQLSSRTQCTLEIDLPLSPDPVASCIATADGANVTVDWPEANGAEQYILYRTVNENGPYWRGRVDAPVNSFDDTLRDGNILYYVASRSGTQLSTQTQCAFNQLIDPSPIAACTANRGVGDQVTISWTNAPGADSHVIYRSVGGNGPYWRATVDAPTNTFDDILRSGVIEYSVSSKYGNSKQVQVPCTPIIQ